VARAILVQQKGGSYDPYCRDRTCLLRYGHGNLQISKETLIFAVGLGRQPPPQSFYNHKSNPARKQYPTQHNWHIRYSMPSHLWWCISPAWLTLRVVAGFTTDMYSFLRNRTGRVSKWSTRASDGKPGLVARAILAKQKGGSYDPYCRDRTCLLRYGHGNLQLSKPKETLILP
jgi:hypothetical protein